MPAARALLCAASAAMVGLALLSGAPTAEAALPVPVVVQADGETAPTQHAGDSADDPALWVHPTDPAASLVIGNDKLGALEVYGLDGVLRQRITSGTTFWGNVDVRQGVTIGGRGTDVIAAYNGGGLRLYGVDPALGLLQPVTEGDGPLPTDGGEGLCLYASPTGQVSAFVITRPGRVSQFLLGDGDSDGLLDATAVRSFAVGSEAEGCVADDVHGMLYIGEEDVGLWRYGAEPGDGTARTLVDAVLPAGNLAADVEGVTLVDAGGGAGHLIVSAQNVADPTESYFAVYDRQTNAYSHAFRIGDGLDADGCSRTDGITAYAGDLGPSFPSGVFICQDDHNAAPGASGNQNFKLTRLEKVVDLAAGGGNLSPTAAFVATCEGLTCSFDARDSADPDGVLTDWSWDFGDGSTGTGVVVSHGYTAPGDRTVTLTVRDDGGALARVSRVASPTGSPTTSPSFVAAASANGNRTEHSVQVPAVVEAGDTLLLFFTGNVSTTTITGPVGWTAAASIVRDGIVGRSWTRTAVSGDAASVVQVSSSGILKADLTVTAYRGAGPVGAAAVAADTTSARAHTTPRVDVAEPGGWLVSYWADKSASTTGWTTPAGQIARSASTGTGGGHITAVLTDGGTPSPAEPQGGLTATADASASRTVMFSVALTLTGPAAQPPTASFTVFCVELECSFDASASADPDGSISSYGWDFGDGATGTGPAVGHGYASAGPRTVTLTVTDDSGASASTTRTATPASSATAVAFVAAGSANGNRLTHSVVVPGAVQPGDALLLFFVANTHTPVITPPAGWIQVQRAAPSGLVAYLWWRNAQAGDAGSTVSVRSSVYVKADLTVAAYRGTAVEALSVSAVGTDAGSAGAHTTPAVTVVESGSWLVSYWADKSMGTSAWALPAGQQARSASTGSGGGHITAALADGGAPVPPGSAGGLTATADASSSRAAMFSAVVRLAG